MDVEKLKQYLQIENNEESECYLQLLSLLENKMYLTDKLVKTIIDELNEILDWYESNTEIVEEVVTYTQKVKKLIYNA